MRKIVLIHIATLFLSIQLYAQKEDILQTISVFPYQQIKASENAIAIMQTWSKKEWRPFLGLLDQDSLKLKASYALHAYINTAALDPQLKKQAAIHLTENLAKAQTYYAKQLMIQQLGLLGDDIAIKSLAKLLNDATYSSSASMALASIHSDASINALKKALKKSSGSSLIHIQAALDHVQASVPVIVADQAWTGSNPFKQNVTQQLLNIQKGMDTAKNSIQQKRCLWQASRINSLGSFMWVSNYLDDPILRNDAAGILTKLALANHTIIGNEVRSALEKSLPLLKGEDSAIMSQQLSAYVKTMPNEIGFIRLFNGKDLTGWKGLVGNPISRSKMTEKELTDAQQVADKNVQNDWIVKNGLLVFTGHGENLVTVKQFADIELYVDWKITAKGDAGIYLRGSPQVQIWDTSRREVGAQVGSGGLYNNQKNERNPIVVADNPIGEWNNFHIIMKGDKVTVYLNGILVTDSIVLENYWDRKQPIFSREQIELQAHGTYVAYRNIYLREIK